MPVWLANIRDIFTALAVFGGAATFVWGAFQWIVQRRDERRRDRFITYHKLVKELVQGDGPDDAEPQTYLHRQIAIAYELRRFRGYWPVTVRLLRHFRNTAAIGHPALAAEIDRAIAHIRRPWWKRPFVKRLDC